MRIRLSDATIKNAQRRRKRVELWDDVVVGLHVIVTAKGAASYYIRYRRRKRHVRFKIDRCDRTSIAEARTKARDLLQRIALHGADPQGEKRAFRDQGLLFPEAFERFLGEPGSRGPRKPRTNALYRQLFRDHLAPALKRVAVNDLQPQDVERLKVTIFNKIGKGRGHGQPAAAVANRAIALLGSILTAAERWGTIPVGTNPCRVVRRFHEQPRERFLSPEERAQVEEALLLEKHYPRRRSAVFAIQLLAATGLRKSNVLGLVWSNVVGLDGDHPSLHLPDSKTGPVTIPLTSQAADLLKEHRPTNPKPNALVCGTRRGRGKHKSIVNLNRFWGRVRRSAQVENIRIHDLRHSFASDGVNAGVPLQFVGAMLGHRAGSNSTARYAHIARDALRREVARTGNAVAESLKTGQASAQRRAASKRRARAMRKREEQ